MLPKLLCEELCSLNPLRDRLTFSVLWKLTPEGKVSLHGFGCFIHAGHPILARVPVGSADASRWPS